MEANQPSSSHLEFPRAQQAQIIRANQRDLYHVSRLRDQVENVLSTWMGSRWLTRWDKEVDLLVKACYFGLTSGRASQTLGEEYTEIWEYSSLTRTCPPSPAFRVPLLILSLLPSYVFGRWGQASSFNEKYPALAKLFRRISTTLDIAMEINLAIFYMRGTYYDLSKRFLGIKHLSSRLPDPHTRPPSYSLLGIMLAGRLLYRFLTLLQKEFLGSRTDKGKRKATQSEMFLDDRPVSSMLDECGNGSAQRLGDVDENTALDLTAISSNIRASRNCTLCLEERRDTCATECGHLFCWSCIVGWGREKAECPLCRQSLSIAKLLPIYNL